MKKIRIEIEKWGKSQTDWAVYIDEKYYEDLSKDMVMGEIIKSIERME